MNITWKYAEHTKLNDIVGIKDNNTSGSQGSKGVGKAAYYGSSYLRTILVSTK